MSIIHNTSVDFTRRVISEPVHIVQGDRTLPTLAVELLSDGQPYTVPDGAQVNIALNKKDGTFVLNTADSVDGNIATFTVTAQMAAVAGDFTPEVQIVNGAGQATTGKFPYIVDKAEIQEGMLESISEVTSLINYADRAEKAADRAQEAADKADTVAINTEAAEKAATDAAASATAAADSATASANSATAAKASASASAQSSASALQSAQLAEQYKNEAFSGTPTGYEDLVNKVNSIYRETASDFASIGTSEGSALAKRIYGMSVQDGTPTPDSPVEIESAKADFKCVGKNLIPYPYYKQSGYSTQGMTGTYGDDGIITVNKVAGSATARFILYDSDYKLLIPNTRYKLSMSLENTNSASVFIAVNNRDIAAIRNKASGNYNYTFTTANELLGTTKIGIYFSADDVESNCKVKVMLTLADADQTYEVNQHTDITTDLTLRAIEVTSSDGYNLERDGKYYIADTIDWSEDKGYVITRRIKEITINRVAKIGSLPRYGMISTSIISPNEFKLPSSQNIRPNAVMTHFATATIQEFINNDGKFYFNPTNEGHVFIRNDNMTSLADWNARLSENPVIFQGILVNPTTEPITSEQAQALLSLKTYDEATSISATGDIEPSLDLEYSKDRNTALALTGHNLGFKSALKLNDINTALIELGGTV